MNGDNHPNRAALRWIGVGALALALPFAADAQEAFTRGAVTLRAGPSSDYPAIVRLAPGQPLNVLGCTRGYGWCDVVLPDGLRGWAAAQRLDYPYRGGNVPLASYGATIGVPIVAFSIGSYWGDHYRDRSWYGDRRWWGNRPPPPPQPGWRPPPPPQAGWQPRPPGPGPGGPGYGPLPNRPHPGRPGGPGGPGFGPDPGYRPHPGGGGGPRPPRDPGVRPPQPGPGMGQPGPRPGPGPGPGMGPRPGGGPGGGPGMAPGATVQPSGNNPSRP